MQNRDLTKVDFAKKSTTFTEDYERALAIARREAWKAITPRGWLNRMFHAMSGKSILGNWN